MGYLTNRGDLEHLAELMQYLPEGWTYNTPCKVAYVELEDFREISHSNPVFVRMLKTGGSINQMLNKPGWRPPVGDAQREQVVAALAWAEVMDDEMEGRYRHHFLDSGSYPHTMWARHHGVDEYTQAIRAIDLSKKEQVFKDRFFKWCVEIDRWQTGNEESVQPRSSLQDSLGWATRASWKANKLSYEGIGRWATRTPNAGRKRRGSTLADKRRGVVSNRRSKAVWV